MKKIILVMMTTFAVQSTMAIDSVVIKNLKGALNQDNQYGLFEYDQLTYTGEPLGINSSVSQIETSFIQGQFVADYHEINLNYDFGMDSALAGIKNITTDSLNLNYQRNESLFFSTSSIELSHSGGTQTIPQVSLSCKNNQKSMVSDISALCLSLADLSIPELSFDQLSAKSVAKALNKSTSIDSIENLRLLIFDHNYQMQFKVKYLFNWTVKADGNIQFDEDKKLLSIYLNKAKVGIISLKGKILDQIRDANLESIRVNGSYIYIQL